MAYYRPGDRIDGYPIGPGLGEDGPAFGGPSEIGAIDRGFRPGGGYGREGYGREGYGREGYGREGYGREGYGREGYGREGYGREGYIGLPGYVDDGYERGRPIGGEYYGGAPEYYGTERPGGYGYGREGYAPGGYGQGYPPQQQIIVQPPVEYIEPESSDLGMGLRDSHKVNLRHPTDYGAGYGRSDLAGYGGASGYGRTEYDEAEMRRLRKELEHEKHRKHEFELATVGALGYGLHERHEKNEAEEELERYGRGKEKKHHHFSRGDY